MIHGRTDGGLCPFSVSVFQLFFGMTEKMCYSFPLRLFVGVIVTEYNLCLRFVSSLPLTDFQFTMSLSHDVPLATSLGHCLYVLGSIQRTGEKLLLQYNARQGEAELLIPPQPGKLVRTV